MSLRVYDSNGNRVAVGDTLADVAGTVTAILEPDGDHHARVEVTYDDGTVERWSTSPDGPGYAFYTCDEIEVSL